MTETEYAEHWKAIIESVNAVNALAEEHGGDFRLLILPDWSKVVSKQLEDMTEQEKLKVKAGY